MKVQQALLYAWFKVNANGAHVADDLAGRLLKSKVQAVFTTSAGGVRELRRNAGLPGSRRSGHQHAASAEESLFAKHLVQTGDSSGNACGGSFVSHGQQSNKQHRDAIVAD